jgi:arylsulfatase A-like enzyme
MDYRPDVRRVVVVVLDGLRPDAIPALGLRCWQRLAREGAASLRGTTVGPSVTAAAMASLLTGVPPEAHGLRSDRFHLPRRRQPLHPLPRVLAESGLPTSTFVRSLPLFFRRLGRRIAGHLGVGNAAFAGHTATEILFHATETLAHQERGLVLLHWPDCDRAGHAHGWMSERYARAAHRLDLALGMLAACADVGRDPSTLLIALADHGGGGVDPRDHASDHALDRTIPVLLAGGAVAGEELDAPSLLDVPATVLWALGLGVPSSYTGRPLLEAFLPAPIAVGQG